MSWQIVAIIIAALITLPAAVVIALVLIAIGKE